MRKRATIWFAVFGAILLLAAQPVSAATASLNTTDADFNNATTRADFRIDGTGTGATIQSTAIIEDFSDGNLNVSDQAPQWSGWTGDTQALSTDGNLTADQNTTEVSISRTGKTKQPSSFRIGWAKSATGDFAEIEFSQSGTEIGTFRIIGNSTATYLVFNGDIITTTTSSARPWEVTIDWDYSNDQATVYVDGVNEGTHAFANSGSGINEIDLRIKESSQVTGPRELNLYELYEGGLASDIGTPGEPTYIGSPHTVDDATEAFVDIDAITGGTAEVTWQGNSGSGWSDIQTYDLTTAGLNTTTLSGSFDQYRVRIDHEKSSRADTMTVSQEGVNFTSSSSTLANEDPADGSTLSSYDGDISVDLNDSDFGTAQGDTVTVEAYDGDGDQIDSVMVSSNQTISFFYSAKAGNNNITWWANDSYGSANTKLTQNFTSPTEFTIRNVSDPDTLVSPTTVTVRFFDNETIIENVTTTGSVPLPDNTTNQVIVAEVSADSYHPRSTLIEGVFDQQSIYLLNTSINSVEVRFTLSDRTGTFAKEESYVKIQRPLNVSGELQWRTVAGDYFGPAGFTTDLEENQKYRIIIKNEDGDSRVLGTYRAVASETVPLEVGEVSADPGDGEQTLATESTYTVNKTGSTDVIDFSLTDNDRETTQITIEIYEYGNQSNVLTQSQTFADIYGTFSYSETVPSNQEENRWVVNVTYVRNGETFTRTDIVGPRSDVLSDMPGWLRALISIGSIWVVAGLFSQLNGDVGAVVVAGMGGMFWFVDFLPGETGVGVVALSLITAGAIMLNQRRGGGL